MLIAEGTFFVYIPSELKANVLISKTYGFQLGGVATTP